MQVVVVAIVDLFKLCEALFTYLFCRVFAAPLHLPLLLLLCVSLLLICNGIIPTALFHFGFAFSICRNASSVAKNAFCLSGCLSPWRRKIEQKQLKFKKFAFGSRDGSPVGLALRMSILHPSMTRGSYLSNFVLQS